MVKKSVCILVVLLLIIPPGLGEDVESHSWVMMENLREHADYVWNTGDETAAYSAQKDVFPIVLSPEEAYAALTRAYEEQGEAGTAAYLQALGIEGYAPSGRPVMHTLNTSEFAELGSILVVAFSGWGWGEEGSLLFMEKHGQWLLIDFVDEACIAVHPCCKEGTFIVMFLRVSHGTGCYAEYIDLYNLSTMKIEAGYTRNGYEVFQDSGVRCYGTATWSNEGLNIFRELFCLRYDETADDYLSVGSVMDVFHYMPDENGSLKIVEE